MHESIENAAFSLLDWVNIVTETCTRRPISILAIQTLINADRDEMIHLDLNGK